MKPGMKAVLVAAALASIDMSPIERRVMSAPSPGPVRDPGTSLRNGNRKVNNKAVKKAAKKAKRR